MSRTGQIISHFPDFYRSGDSENLFYQHIKVFASMIDDAEEELLRVMKTHWVNTADNEGSKGFDAAEKGDLDKILSLYLESLGGTALLKQGKRRTGAEGKLDDALYRTRILGLIQVLKNGASTRAGIIDIVAANLGIVSDLPYALHAHDSIQIIEFLPELVDSGAGSVSATLYKDIQVFNDSPLPVLPEFRIRFQNDLPMPLVNPRIAHPLSGDFVQYIGTVTPGDALDFLSDGTGLFRGQSFQPVGSLRLPAGVSKVRLEAKVGIPQGNFDTSFFNYSQFNTATLREMGVFDEAQFDNSTFAYENAVASVQISYAKLSPGAFMVVIPWDVPGFSVNITITQHTLDRLPEFDLPSALVDAIAASGLLNKEFETREAFFAALGPVVADHVSVNLQREHVSKLNLFGVSIGLANRIMSLLPPGIDTISYATITEFFAAVTSLTDADKKMLHGALGCLVDCDGPLSIVLREALFTDKYARFNISPRGQIKAIVDRVKAAGVYAVIAFEKRFFEDQQLSDSFGLVLAEPPYDQGMTESNFDLLSNQSAVEQQDMADAFRLSGVFDYTRFGTLNTFA